MLLIRFDVFSFHPFQICMCVMFLKFILQVIIVCIAEKSFEMIVIYSDNSTMSNLTV